ncbi:RNA polymerase sigma-70 factor [Flavobacteriaceae bacterium F08102]|nr:RNA polymerase sigma-70 factor [Flavobacteriaceae bacterium F08102]
MDDIAAAKALKRNDKKAFKFLFDTYYDPIVAYILTFTHDKMKAEDIVQQAFVNLWEDRRKLDYVKSPKPYIYKIAYFRYIDSIKHDKKRNKLLDDIWHNTLVSTIEEDDEELLNQRIEKLREVINLLPPKCKEILILNKIKGLKYREIAETLGISIKTVENQMSKAFRKIRNALKEDPLFLFMLFAEKRYFTLNSPV